MVRQWTTFWLASVSLTVAVVLLTGGVVARRVKADLARTAQASAALHAGVLRSELTKHRSLPFVLAQDADVITVLQNPTPERLERLNRKLETLCEGTGAAVIYLLNADGRTVAASNWRQPTTFVGEDYSFRPYFRDAKRVGVAEMFALGTSSRRPGLYLAQRVDGPTDGLGVVVVKAEFEQLERDWSSDHPAFATDAHGAILVTSIPPWRFLTLSALSEAEQRRLRAEQRFGKQPFSVLSATPQLRPERKPFETSVSLPGSTASQFMAASTELGSNGWTVFALTPIGVTVKAAVGAAWAASLLICLVLCGLAAAVLRWRSQAFVRAARQDAARAELEARVQERTTELRDANRRLMVEMEERRRAESHALLMQDQLVQSNKLATLGQIAAGVAHEINQPLAAIRSYADNSLVFLKRADVRTAEKNLGVIAELTTRIGVITDELRAFARKSGSPPAPVEVAKAIEGALLLLGARIRQQGVTVTHSAEPEGLRVMAERFRLEQVLVNLLQNALEALEGARGPHITIRASARYGKVRIVVSDNGPGLSAEAAGTVFTPFATTKARGLGLGLVISRDIVAEFGGELSFEPGAGATFVITLPKAR
jgi:two-component system C4-dicarboxylate transport sensor histidine kinase DctB